MNTTNILLGTTSLLLVVAFALSFGDFNKNRNSASANKEYEEIRAELAAQKALFDKMQLENLRSNAIKTPAPAPIAPDPAQTGTAPLSEDLKSKLEAEIAKLKDEKDKAELKADTNEKETLILMGEKTKAAQRQERDAQRVTNALLMGNVSAFKKDWAWLSFSPTDSANFQPGQELGIRRNSGILGRITIDRFEGDQYVANVKENAYAGGIPDIVEGDEIIVIPPFYGVGEE